MRWSYHRNMGLKLAGIVLCLLALGLALYGNLGVAHYRDLLGGYSTRR